MYALSRFARTDVGSCAKARSPSGSVRRLAFLAVTCVALATQGVAHTVADG